MKAIDARDCMDGVFLRLNLNAIAKPENNQITIISGQTVNHKWMTQQRPTKEVTITRTPKKDAFVGQLRDKIKQFLQSQNRYTSSIDAVYSGLHKSHISFDFEQALLGWMGYLILRTIAEKADGIRMNNKSILVQRTKYLTDNRE